MLKCNINHTNSVDFGIFEIECIITAINSGRVGGIDAVYIRSFQNYYVFVSEMRLKGKARRFVLKSA